MRAKLEMAKLQNNFISVVTSFTTVLHLWLVHAPSIAHADWNNFSGKRQEVNSNSVQGENYFSTIVIRYIYLPNLL